MPAGIGQPTKHAMKVIDCAETQPGGRTDEEVKPERERELERKSEGRE